MTPETLNAREQKAVSLLVEEIEKRSTIRLSVVHQRPPRETPEIMIGPASRMAAFSPPAASGKPPGPEGYRLLVVRQPRTTVWVLGADSRGVLYGVGRLLRALSLSAGQIVLPDELNINSTPRFAVRGHQLGYRPKTNSYDAWTPEQFEQYVRDLAVFGANSIEILPPRTDDADTSPHMKVPKLEMMTFLSRMLDSYGLDVWIWYPNMARNYSDPETVKKEMEERREIFKTLPRIDAVFVPGGDPGDVPSSVLMSFLAKEADLLHEYHPKAKIWVSPQGFDHPADWWDTLYGTIRSEQPKWLGGLVFGPQVKTPLPELRALLPRQYPIRRYPDITHSLRCQYPVPNWDIAFASTLGREPINPRPLGEAHIHNLFQEYAIGSIAYSEGINDDVNKIVWSSLDWDPTTPVLEILRQYSRYFIGDHFAEEFAQGLLALERNWNGPAATNTGIETTLRQWQAMEKEASPPDLGKWRFQQALMRAYYDAYVRRRLSYETELEQRALDELRRAPEIGAGAAALGATTMLNRARFQPVATDYRRRIEDLAHALFESIGAQLSVAKYKAISVGRGAFLDTVDEPLNNSRWLLQRLEAARSVSDENERQRQIQEVLDRTNPGPGGFYDHLASETGLRRIKLGPGWEKDPGFLRSVQVGFSGASIAPPIPLAWRSFAETFFDQPLTVTYDGLDPNATYQLRVVYGRPRNTMKLVANGKYEVQRALKPPSMQQVQQFDLPREVTASGHLELTWSSPDGGGCQVSEIWLVRR